MNAKFGNSLRWAWLDARAMPTLAASLLVGAVALVCGVVAVLSGGLVVGVVVLLWGAVAMLSAGSTAGEI